VRHCCAKKMRKSTGEGSEVDSTVSPDFALGDVGRLSPTLRGLLVG